MEELTFSILKKFNNISLDTLAEDFPTTLTTDSHLLKAENYLNEGKCWDTFHHLSLCHSTLLYHRIVNKLSRPQNEKNSGNQAGQKDSLSEDFSKKLTLSKESNVGSILHPSTSEETKRNLQLLPSDWTVIQITSDPRASGIKSWKKIEDPFGTPTLYISRCRCGPKPSIVIRKVHPPKDDDSVRGILQEMELIKRTNKVIFKSYQNDLEKYVATREDINNRLRVLVRSMENAWLRHYACMLSGSLPVAQETQVVKRVKEALHKLKIPLSEDRITLLTLMVTYPLPTPSTKESVTFDFPLRAGIAAVLEESVRSAKVRNLATSLTAVQETIKELRNMQRNPVILVVDKNVVTLPWEMILALRNQSATRMPSVHSLVHLYSHHSQKADSLLTKGIDVSKGFYILDPDGNLPRSQERLQKTFIATNWEGIVGTRPSHEQFKEALASKDVFVYVGHGSGSQYMPAHLVETLDCRSMVLLYGCSSASLARRGTIPDPWGVVLNYLIASCPCVVGMLWEVMDRDTDLLTKAMVRAIHGLKGPSGSPLSDPPTEIPLLVAKARPLCTWYLISAALVVYGLPLHVIPPEDSGSESS